MMPICTRRISAACIIMLAAITGACADANPAGVAVPKQPAHSASIAATAWTATGPGTVVVASDGTAGDAVMTYEHAGDPSLHTWDFETTADQTATVTRPWHYQGIHETIDGAARAVVYAVVNDVVVATLIDQNVHYFIFSGTYTFNVSAGDTYGFRLGGSSDEGQYNYAIGGTFKVGQPEGPVEPVTLDDCKDGGWMAFGFRNQGQCIAFVQTGHDGR